MILVIEFLKQNMYTIIVLAVLIVIVALIIRSLVNKKGGGCTGDCSSCGGSCSSADGSKYMVKTTLAIDGMMCSMCESHLQDAIRANFDVKKVKASHQKGTIIIISKHRLDEEKLKNVIRETGYTLQNIQFELAK